MLIQFTIENHRCGVSVDRSSTLSVKARKRKHYISSIFAPGIVLWTSYRFHQSIKLPSIW